MFYKNFLTEHQKAHVQNECKKWFAKKLLWSKTRINANLLLMETTILF
jgi:hypothetical protein